MAIDAGFTITVWEESRGKSPLPPPPPNPSLTFSVIMRYPDFGPLLKNYMASAELGLVVPAVAVLTKYGFARYHPRKARGRGFAPRQLHNNVI
jgi:hypothetical protein